MSNLEIGVAQYAQFIRIDAALRERAVQLFKERSQDLNEQLRYEIRSIEFDESGCSISYTSTHCSSCRHYDEIDYMYVSLSDLLPLAPAVAPRQPGARGVREGSSRAAFRSALPVGAPALTRAWEPKCTSASAMPSPTPR